MFDVGSTPIDVSLSDTIAVMSLPILSAALEAPVNDSLRQRIASSPRLRRLVAEKVCKDFDYPAEATFASNAPSMLLLRGDMRALETAIRQTAGCLCATHVRRAVSIEDVTTLRTRFGDDGYEAALDYDGPVCADAHGMPGVEAGWIALGRWIAQQEPACVDYLQLRFTSADIKRMNAMDPHDAAFASAFEIACERAQPTDDTEQREDA